MKICVFAGAGGNPADCADAYEIGNKLALAGHTLYTGGSAKGIMGAVARGAWNAKGVVKGILPEKILDLGNASTNQFTVPVKDMFARKAMFWDDCESFLCLPGGLGTLDELFEIACLVKLGYKPASTPIVVYDRDGDTNSFYRPLRDMLANMAGDGYLRESAMGIIQFRWNIEAAVQAVTRTEGPYTAPGSDDLDDIETATTD